MTEVLVLMGVGTAAWFMTGMTRRYALRRSLVDVPNRRSSHTVPTPRGGGLAIALVVLAGIAGQMLYGGLDPKAGTGMLLGGALVALLGWIDDHRHVRALVRALGQLVAAAWAVYWIGVPDSLTLGPWTVSLGPAGPPLAAICLVWLTNLFNFMDGIDGIAAAEATTVAAVGGILLLTSGAPALSMTAFMVAVGSGGFLIWNWAPARIFMGDVGSGFLGFLLGSIALGSAVRQAVPPVVWVLLLGVFLFDATVTLLRRVGREKFYEAHRRHAYQRMVQAGWSHGRVTTAVLMLNAALAALAAGAWIAPRYGPLALLTGALLLAFIYRLVERRLPMWAGEQDRVGLQA